MNGNVKLQKSACGSSQWRMGPTFFQMLLVVKALEVSGIYPAGEDQKSVAQKIFGLFSKLFVHSYTL